jgi:glycosyltransferase involved in cell wall biosynthesis/DNA uptake protein ComE-like DNA-binding protein
VEVVVPKISIITPVYIDIAEKITWLDECIRSVLSQSFADFEMILIDDKSPLDFSAVKARYASDSRLRFLENAQNQGPSKTRNTAVALAESDCILPLDSDDMLADNEVLIQMYSAWQQDKSKIIYGNLRQLMRSYEGFRQGRVISLGEYTFDLAMNLEGIMPVTAMHSVKCHQEAGGWKHALNEGLEDVEYWIAAGKRGCCGQKIQHTVLLYRRQEESRAYKLKHIYKNFRAMQDRIKSMHSDIYNGRFPMACCGKGNTSAANAPAPNTDPLVLSAQNQRVSKISELQGYPETDLEWVTYVGPKRGRFDILARGASNLPNKYTILGTGHAFQIHKAHHKIFSDRQHLHFRINQPDPREQIEPEPELKPEPEPQVVEIPKPELSTLVRFDSVAHRSDKQAIQGEVIIEPNAAQSVSDVMKPQLPTDYFKPKVQPVSNLGLGDALTSTLDEAGYTTVEKIANVSTSALIELKGIGEKRAQAIIAKAKELISTQ